MTGDAPSGADDAASATDAASTAEPETVVELQQELRPELKEPLGPIYTDADALLADATRPLVAVGDIVTYHLLEAGYMPAVALVDGRTKRTAVDEHIQEALDSDRFDHERRVANPPATLSARLLSALREGLDDGGTTIIIVDGEEDLAALPAVVAAAGGSVVYGQPDEGMVLVACEGEALSTVRDLLARMDGDTARLWELLGVDAD